MELESKDYPFTRDLSKPGNHHFERNHEAHLSPAGRYFGWMSREANLSVECCHMSESKGASLGSALTQLEEKLREVDERLRSEMRARGFDPDQEDNVALTGPLAKLYLERESLREELDTLSHAKDLTVE